MDMMDAEAPQSVENMILLSITSMIFNHIACIYLVYKPKIGAQNKSTPLF